MIYASKPWPWPEGGPKIDNFASGLIRKTQAYLVPAGEGQEIANDQFAIDTEIEEGFFIFPAPTVESLNNGFDRISVTSYGRREDFDYVEIGYNAIPFAPRVIPVYQNLELILAPTARILKVVRRGENPILSVDSNTIFNENPPYSDDGLPVSTGGLGLQVFNLGNGVIATQFGQAIVTRQSTFYGMYSEWVIGISFRFTFDIIEPEPEEEEEP